MIRVTEVLQAYTNFDMIKPDVLDFASVRGTQAHKAIENILTGKWTPIPENARPYVNSFKIGYCVNNQRIVSKSIYICFKFYRNL